MSWTSRSSRCRPGGTYGRVVLPGADHGEVHADEVTLDDAIREVEAAAPGALVPSAPARWPTSARSVAHRLDLIARGHPDRGQRQRLRRRPVGAPAARHQADHPEPLAGGLVIDSRRPGRVPGPDDPVRAGRPAVDVHRCGGLVAGRPSSASTPPTRPRPSRSCARGSTETMAAAAGLRTNHPDCARLLAAALTQRRAGDGSRGSDVPVVGRRAHDQPSAGDGRATACHRASAHSRRAGGRGQRGGRPRLGRDAWAAAGRAVRASRRLDPNDLSVAGTCRVHATWTGRARWRASAGRRTNESCRWVNDHLDQIAGGLRRLAGARRG